MYIIKLENKGQKMKRKLALIAIFLIFITGVGILSYPLVSSIVNNLENRSNASAYMEKAKAMKTDKIDKLFKEADDYNRSLTSNVVLTDPFDASMYEEIGAHYKETFNAGEKGLIGYVDVPKINVYLPIYHGASDDTLERGAGHLENTSLPIGGRSTHSVISAHSNFPGKTFFNYLTDLEEEDEFYIHVLNKTLKYKVNQIKVVLPNDTDELYVVNGKDYITLLTCTPFAVNTHRLLVRGERVEYDPKKTETSLGAVNASYDGIFFFGYKISYYLAAGLIIGFVVVVVAVAVFIVIKNRRKQEENTGGDDSA